VLLDNTDVDTMINCPLPKACLCEDSIRNKEEVQHHQVYELPKIKLRVTEYQLQKGRICTQTRFYATIRKR
jgi:transposase